jgi:phospholipase C
VKRVALSAAAAALVVAAAGYAVESAKPDTSANAADATNIKDLSVTHQTSTPIKHVVVLFDENISFDHYFGTYPNATNPSGEPAFHAKPGTPSVNGLTSTLLDHNRNKFNPTRLSRSQAVTCDQNHADKPEQQAYDHGLADKFVEFTDSGDCSAKFTGEYYRPGLVMDYYDGNTVTGLWNYAQRFALSDSFYGTQFGPSSPGAVNLVSGQTHGAELTGGTTPTVSQGTMVGDPQPLYDDCHTGTVYANMTGKNVGDLMNEKGMTWGWFQGGFKPTSRTASGNAVCGAQHANVAGNATADYIQHHEPFQYYKSTSNPHHLPPSSVANIGKTDQANHQYDLSDFWDAADAGRMPEVSFLKARAFEDGHGGYSDPIDEQHFLVSSINHLQRLPQWKSTAVVIAYDDSDGWYDHQMPPIVFHSEDPANDALSADGMCGTADNPAIDTRCGYGPRVPLLVLSPFAKSNYVDSATTDQSSILAMIEDNWSLGRIGSGSADEFAGSLDNMFDFHAKPDTKPLMLDPDTGEPVKG